MILDERDLVRIRRTADGYVDGVFVPGAGVEAPFVGALQSPSRRQVQHLSEGDRLRDPRVVLSDDPVVASPWPPGLREADPLKGDDGAPDRVRDPRSGFVYEVQETRFGSILPHVEALVLRVRE